MNTNEQTNPVGTESEYHSIIAGLRTEITLLQRVNARCLKRIEDDKATITNGVRLASQIQELATSRKELHPNMVTVEPYSSVLQLVRDFRQKENATVSLSDYSDKLVIERDELIKAVELVEDQLVERDTELTNLKRELRRANKRKGKAKK